MRVAAKTRTKTESFHDEEERIGDNWMEALVSDAEKYVQSVFQHYEPIPGNAPNNTIENSQRSTTSTVPNTVSNDKKRMECESDKKSDNIQNRSKAAPPVVKAEKDRAAMPARERANSTQREPGTKHTTTERNPSLTSYDTRDDWKESSISEAIRCASSLLLEPKPTTPAKSLSGDEIGIGDCVGITESPRSITKDIYNLNPSGEKRSTRKSCPERDSPPLQQPLATATTKPDVYKLTPSDTFTESTTQILYSKDGGQESWESVFFSNSCSFDSESDSSDSGYSYADSDSSASTFSTGNDSSFSESMEDESKETLHTDIRIELSMEDSIDENLSFDSEDEGNEVYNTWDLLKDEYAGDFGFEYCQDSKSYSSDEDGSGNRRFKILGTSVDDQSSKPHVLSPPLMEALTFFVPESISRQNFWLKYSLVRDGANLMTLQRYVRGSNFSILAIETTKGDVFGCFTSMPWRKTSGFYGNGQSFVWKMRQSRLDSGCRSLYDLAKMEQEIDVFPYSNYNNFIQLCTDDMIAIGAGAMKDAVAVREISLPGFPELDNPEPTTEEDARSGFAIALQEDLFTGTSSPCATFCNPCLSDSSLNPSQVFEVSNIEVWAFTPCTNVHSAEKLEMMKYLRENKSNGTSAGLSFPSSSEPGLRSDSFQDHFQKSFYERVGAKESLNVGKDWTYSSREAKANVSSYKSYLSSTPRYER